MICTTIKVHLLLMSEYSKMTERQLRAERLKQARLASGHGGVKAVSKKFGWNVNRYKAHDSGQNGFGLEDARAYAKAFGVSLQWLYAGIGVPEDKDEAPTTIDVPVVSWVSAGQLTEQSGITTLDDYPTVPTVDLPDGNWIALRVEGDSMDRISPYGSIIFINLKDRRLVPNACYVIADETGAATYKRYRPNEIPPFQPYSTKDIPPPILEGTIKVIGRVRRSIIEI